MRARRLPVAAGTSGGRYPRKVTVQYQNRDGVHCEKTVEGLFARAVCHELDHLDGKLYIDVMDRELTPEEIEGHIPEDDNQ